MWFAGLDWADQHHDLVVIDEAGRHVGSRRVTHSSEGFAQLRAFLLSISGSDRKQEVACVIETNHGLLISFLLEMGYPVYPVNPKTVDRQRNASGAKTDQIDAYLLAKHGRSEFADLRRLEPDNPVIAELKTLTRDQDGLIQMQTRLVNQLTACLKTYYPVALQLFSKLQQTSTLVFLQTYPTLEAVQAATQEQVTETLKQTEHPTPEKNAAKIVEMVRHPQLQADEVTNRTKSRLMLALVRQLLPVVEEIADYDKEIEQRFLSHEDNDVFSSLPRAGKRLAPRLLAEIGDDPKRYEKAMSLQALAGTAPSSTQVGNIPNHIAGKPVSNLCAMRCTSSHGKAHSRKPGPERTMTANVKRAKATRLLFVPSPTCGPEFSLP